MYCRNCGNKLEEDDIYCISCGLKVNYRKKIPLIDIKKMPNWTKNSLISLIVLLVLILGGSFLYRYYYSEDAIISRYIKAYVNGDYNTVIKLSGINNDKFINSNNIKRKYNSKTDKQISIKSITKNSTKGKEYNRTIIYTVDGYTNNYTVTLKKSGKKFFIFNNYVIKSNNLLAENVSFTAPKNATITVDNVKMNNKYLFTSNKETNTYKIDKLLSKNVKICLNTSNGLNICDIKSVFNNEEVDFNELNYNILDKNTENKIKNILKDSITKIIDSSTKGEEVDNIQNDNNFVKELTQDELFTENYNKMKEKYANRINEFSINNIEIENIKLFENNRITSNVKIDYSYKNNNDIARESSKALEVTLNEKLLVEELYLTNLIYMFLG